MKCPECGEEIRRSYIEVEIYDNGDIEITVGCGNCDLEKIYSFNINED